MKATRSAGALRRVWPGRTVYAFMVADPGRDGEVVILEGALEAGATVGSVARHVQDLLFKITKQTLEKR